LSGKDYKYIIIILCVLFFRAQGQSISHLSLDTLPLPSHPANAVLSEIATDTFPITTPPVKPLFSGRNDLSKVKIAEDAPEESFSYSSEQYNRLKNADRTLLLIGGARVEFQGNVLEGDTIVLNTLNKTAVAYSTAKSFVEFTGEGQELKAKSLLYNFETKKGRIFGAITKQSDLFVVAGVTKFAGDAVDLGEGRRGSVGYSKDAVITTCNHPEPHYGLHAYKQKIVQDKVLVTGPANLEIAGVPTPLFLPFALLPLDLNLETGGLIMPRDYDVQPLYGFGLRNIGYFKSFGDHWGAAVYADVYTRGSHGIRLNSNYNYRYRFAGTINLEYANRQIERVGFLEKEKNISYAIRWTHNQDQKASPYSSFSGSVNIITSRHDQFTLNTADANFNNQFSSNVNYNYNFPDKPYRITLNASHTQNSRTGDMKFNLPNASFFLNRIKPFERKERVGKAKWYEALTFQYTGEYKNETVVADSLLFTSAFFDNMKMGMRHRAISDVNFKLFKYLNFTPNINFNETWFFDTLAQTFFPQTFVQRDTTLGPGGEFVINETIEYGRLERSRQLGFAAYRDFRLGVSMNTNLFGMVRFRRGPVKAIRHVLKPNLSYNYQPVFNFNDQRNVRFDNRIDSTLRYSIFEDGIYARPQVGVAQQTLNYNFTNLIEMKVRSRRDSTDKKIRLLENITVAGNYNFNADSVKWSQLGIRGNTRFFKNLTTLGVDVAFDPYMRDQRGRRINTTAWEANRRLLRFDQANLRLTTNFSIKQLRDFIGGLLPESKEEGQKKPSDDLPEFLSMFNEFRISHNFNFGWANVMGRDTFRITTNNITTAGRIKLSEKWNLRVGNIGYEFTRQQFTFPDFGIARDLHCWEMGVDWQPYFGTFSFFIRVKPSSFDFLNIPYRKSSSDVLRGF
jgi:hypothetical protein